MSSTFAFQDVKRGACTMILPASQLQRLEEVKQRTGIPRNTIAALALDEYFQRHYPEAQQQGQNDAASNQTNEAYSR